MRTHGLRLLGFVAAGAFVAGCSERSDLTSPQVAGPTAQRTILPSPTSVVVVTRNTPLAAPLTASATIGVFGGRLALPGAGMVVIIPPFALAAPTTITVTAVAGDQVAYEFEPHGKTFAVPLVVVQNLVGTSAASGGLLTTPLYGGYFANLSDLNLPGGTALVSELLGSSVSSLTKTMAFPVFHFSGYLVASGLEGDPVEGAGTH